MSFVNPFSKIEELESQAESLTASLQEAHAHIEKLNEEKEGNYLERIAIALEGIRKDLNSVIKRPDWHDAPAAICVRKIG